MLALTAAAFAVVADHSLPAHLQRADDAWLRLMISGRAAPVTAVAKVFNWLGLVYVTLPVRIGIAGFLALRRRWWWHLAAFAVGELQGRWTAHRTARSAHPPIPGTVRPADRHRHLFRSGRVLLLPLSQTAGIGTWPS